MKKLSEIVKKYKLHILAVLTIFFFMRSCMKSVEIKKLNKGGAQTTEYVDSLQQTINNQTQKIDSFPQILREEKLDIHTEYDNWISNRDRGSQLMELHMIVKKNIKELKK